MTPIAYYAAGRDGPVGAVLESVVTAMGDEVGGLVRAKRSGPGKLRAYLEGVGNTPAFRPLLTYLLSQPLLEGPDVVPGLSLALYAATSVVLVVATQAYYIACGGHGPCSALRRAAVGAA